MMGFTELPVNKIFTAGWNYKEQDKKLLTKLIANIEENGFLENIIVRELGFDKYEVVNGNHRLLALKKLKIKSVMCFNLGTVNLLEAKRIAVETNETVFETDQIKLSEIIKSIISDFDVSDLEKTMPFSAQELLEISAFSDLEMSIDDVADGDEDFDIDDVDVDKRASVESYADTEKIELLAENDVVDSFYSLLSGVKRKMYPGKSPSVVDDNEAINWILDKLILPSS